MLQAPVSTRQIAESLGLSQPTVSHILSGRGRFSEKTRQRVLRAAHEMGYRPSAAARAMRSQRTGQIGVMVRNEAANPFHYLAAYEMMLALNIELEEAGLLLTLVRLRDARDGDAASRVFTEHLIDGLVVLEDVPSDVQEKLDGLSEQVIWVDSSRYDPTACIQRDERRAGRLAGEAALAAGFRRLIWVGPTSEHRDAFHPESPTHYSIAARYEGVRSVADEAGVAWACLGSAPDLFDGDLIRCDALRDGDAVVAYDTTKARLVTHRANTSGRIPGRDFGLCCCDSTGEIDKFWPGLDRVHCNRTEIGRAAARMMLAALGGEPPESMRFDVQWHAGDTLRNPACS